MLICYTVRQTHLRIDKLEGSEKITNHTYTWNTKNNDNDVAWKRRQIRKSEKEMKRKALESFAFTKKNWNENDDMKKK